MADLATFETRMRDHIDANTFDEAWHMLEEIELANLTNQSYPMLDMLISCGRGSGNEDLEKLAGQVTIRKNLLKEMREFIIEDNKPVPAPPPPPPIQTIESKRKVFYNEREDASWTMFCMVRRRTNYKPRLEVLPYNSRRPRSVERSLRTLASHAEKRALADLLARNATTLSIGINMKVCLDCHDYIQAASVMFRRDVVVREPRKLHKFSSKFGNCSCGGKWRWETKL